MSPINKSQVVFIVHNGKQDYLNVCVRSSRKYGNYTILIGNAGDAANNSDEFYPDAISSAEFEVFRRNYRHMSSNSIDFELLCFRRYFLLLTVAKKKRLNHFWLIDSDVLLLEDLNEFTETFLLRNKYRASLSSQKKPKESPGAYFIAASPHISFWTTGALEDFSNFCLTVYTTHNDVLNLKYQYHLQNGIPGGICDMTILDLWARGYDGVFNNATAHLNGFSFYDHNINTSNNYDEDGIQMIKGLNVKRVYNNRIWCYVWSPILKTRFRVGCLHFQGNAKVLMRTFFHFQKLSYLLCLRFIIATLAKTLVRKCIAFVRFPK